MYQHSILKEAVEETTPDEVQKCPLESTTVDTTPPAPLLAQAKRTRVFPLELLYGTLSATLDAFDKIEAAAAFIKATGEPIMLPKCAGFGSHVTGLPTLRGSVTSFPKSTGVLTGLPKLCGRVIGLPLRKSPLRLRPRGITTFLS